jgi:hypothetical protein
MVSMTDVIPLIQRQSSATLSLWCRQCNLTFKATIPVTMRPEQVECPGCETCGHVVPDTK